MPDWTDELKQEVISKYEAAEPTPETTQEIVKSIAEELGDDFTPNGVMAILTKAGKYVKKTPATGAKTGESKRVNKADAIKNLSELIESHGLEADGDIIGKLTGKAAIYFTDVMKKLVEDED